MKELINVLGGLALIWASGWTYILLIKPVLHFFLPMYF
jgi:hypothetical protein